MNEEYTKKYFFIKGFTIFEVILSILIIVAILWYLIPALTCHHKPTKRVVCYNNLKQLGTAMRTYANETGGKYPSANKWCDLIKPYLDRRVEDKIFQCPSAEKARCNYAMNPNCEPNSPPGTVLLFETKGGWNLSGGLELVTIDNHSGTGCVILFNSGNVNYIVKEKIPNLKWE